MDVQKLKNDSFLSKIFLSKKYLGNTMNTMKRSKRAIDMLDILEEQDSYNDVSLPYHQIGKIHLKSMLTYKLGLKGIRTKRSNTKQIEAV